MNKLNWPSTKVIETTVQWKDKQHWSADQLNRSRRFIFVGRDSLFGMGSLLGVVIIYGVRSSECLHNKECTE